jgi:uncharacterized protein (DUF305 family)
MPTMPRRTPALCLSLLAALALAACGGATPATTPAPEARRDPKAIQADSTRRAFTLADVEFMSGMISHHAQAIAMSRLAPERAASSAVKTLAARIINAQQDEIATMQLWLQDRGFPVPEPDPRGMRMDMEGHSHHMLMPGMLTEAEMAELEAARGVEFDRLFLTYMIKHHEGALTMVDTLFATHGAAQEDLIYKFASDVGVDQTTEVARMERMLDALPPAAAGAAPGTNR